MKEQLRSRGSASPLMQNILLFFAVLITCMTSCGPDLQQTGILTEGRVLSKHTLPIGGKTNYYLTVGYFTQPDRENPQPEKKKDTTRSVDDIINDLGIKPVIGDYNTTDITVTESDYNQYASESYINLKYDKEHPTTVVIAKE